MNDGNNGLKKDYGNDGVHPNMNGYKLMQKMVLDAISNILWLFLKIILNWFGILFWKYKNRFFFCNIDL